MTTAVKGKPVQEAEIMVEQFREMIRGNLNPDTDPHILGKLVLFRGVRDLPSRVKCAVLAWSTLHSALKGEETASTE
jgi:nitrogen fixation NifU-like protein